jgi:hypothetical protein
MRNTTKLKHLLLKYSLTFDMDDVGLFTLSICNKQTGELLNTIEGGSYSIVLNKAYGFFLKSLKV